MEATAATQDCMDLRRLQRKHSIIGATAVTTTGRDNIYICSNRDLNLNDNSYCNVMQAIEAILRSIGCVEATLRNT
jgi:hypothetical protein